MMELKQQVLAMQQSALAMNLTIVDLRHAVNRQDWAAVSMHLRELSAMAFALTEASRLALLNVPTQPPH